MKLFFGKKKNEQDDNLEISKFLLKKLGYRPVDIQLFVKSFTHKSYSNEIEGVQSNERLEYLGDRVIDLIVAEHLFEKYPSKNEGELTKIKSKIVSRKMLAVIGSKMNLLNYIRYKSGRNINTATLEGNAFEALIGALYLDSNYDTTKKLFNRYILSQYIDLNRVMDEEIDFKSKLLIWCQKNKLEIEFFLKEDANKGNKQMYTILVKINNKKWGLGKGKNKKTAEQEASKETLELLGA